MCNSSKIIITMVKESYPFQLLITFSFFNWYQLSISIEISFHPIMTFSLEVIMRIDRSFHETAIINPFQSSITLLLIQLILRKSMLQMNTTFEAKFENTARHAQIQQTNSFLMHVFLLCLFRLFANHTCRILRPKNC